MTTSNLSGRLNVGDWAKILNSGVAHPCKVVEYRGPLGPGGAHINRFRVRGRPYPAYGEFPEDELELIPEKTA